MSFDLGTHHGLLLPSKDKSALCTAGDFRHPTQQTPQKRPNLPHAQATIPLTAIVCPSTWHGSRGLCFQPLHAVQLKTKACGCPASSEAVGRPLKSAPNLSLLWLASSQVSWHRDHIFDPPDHYHPLLFSSDSFGSTPARLSHATHGLSNPGPEVSWRINNINITAAHYANNFSCPIRSLNHNPSINHAFLPKSHFLEEILKLRPRLHVVWHHHLLQDRRDVSQCIELILVN